MSKFILFVALPILFACASMKEPKKAYESGPVLTFIQGDQRINIPCSDTTLTLKKAPLTLEFTSARYDQERDLFYATRIAATRDKKEFDRFKNGPIAEDNTFFGVATGKSCAEDVEYETLYLDNNGHHYIFYSAEDHKRATLIEELADQQVRLQWTIRSVTEDGKEFPLESCSSEEVYLLFFQDRNLNKVIEDGELKKIILRFE
jgi:hypothetical protein